SALLLLVRLDLVDIDHVRMTANVRHESPPCAYGEHIEPARAPLQGPSECGRRSWPGWSACATCYCKGMSTLHARVKGGQIVVEGKTDLPEGTELTLVMVEADDEMKPEERADLEAELERGRAAIAAGKGISGDELLVRVRETR